MYAELASIGYWLALLIGWAVILYSIYKLVETLDFKVYLSAIGVGVFVLYVAGIAGDFAQALSQTDRTAPMITAFALLALLSFTPLVLFGLLMDSNKAPEQPPSRLHPLKKDKK